MSGDRDLLERATSALREASPPTQDELISGRARLLEAHRAAKKSARARTLRWVLPLAAVLAAGSAFAAVPEQLERLASAVTAVFQGDAGELAAAKKKRAPRPAQRTSSSEQAMPAHAASETTVARDGAMMPTTAPEPAIERVSSAQQTRSSDERAEERRRQRRAERARNAETESATSQPEANGSPEPALDTPAPSVSPPEPASDADLASYREAHRRHFRQRDFASALLAWNTYLADFPRGTFAVEARYNRAICLVRLAQNDAAKQALRPFARGDVAHGYRQAEATKLLEALE